MDISFHGATNEVTGSCILLKTKDSNDVERRFLIDCGMFQGEQMCGSKNLTKLGFDPRTLDAVFVTHPHADHTGRLPKLIRDGYRGKIFMSHPCVGLTKLVLEDALHIMTEDAEKCGSPVLYELEDLRRVFETVEGVSYHQDLFPAPGITVRFHDAGHVLGSAYISVDAEGKRVVFSGDIGNDHVPILPPTDPITHATAVVCESTYGNRIHEPITEREDKLRAAIEQTIKQKGVLLIPAFSIERTQELLYALDRIVEHDLKTDIDIYLDSPMAIKATQLYRDYKNYLRFDSSILQEEDRDFFSFKNLHETLSVESSKAINDTRMPKVIIAGSGMMSGGRIMHHLRRYLPDANTTILIIGYQATGTIGRQIFNGAKSVNIFGKRVEVKAKIAAIGAFSAHGDQAKLTRWLQPDDGKIPQKIFLVHGDPEAKTAFATHLRDVLKTEIIIPEYQQSYTV